ncbi:hypothetical protein [Sinomonas sp. P10A9]|uniref:Uncharacterized protein n=1 Tax=Sinomonas puerhi TaxID=3238584 RepID=A0AB39L5S8_9MICC
MKRRIPRSGGALPGPAFPPPPGVSPVPTAEQAREADRHERLIRKLDQEIILLDLL